MKSKKEVEGGKLRALLGVGLDSDGHTRITQGPGFKLVGGSEGTHDKMTRAVMKTNEALRKKGLDLRTAEPERVIDLLRENEQ